VIWENVFDATSFGGCASADAIRRILSAALEAANPANAVQQRLIRAGDLLQFNGQEYPLKDFSAVYLVSVGKAAISMADAASTVLGNHLTAGIVVSKHFSGNMPLRGASFRGEAVSALTNNKSARHFSKLTFLESSHPLPDARSLGAGEKILNLLSKTTSDDLVIFLISGGGSALMTAPVNGVSLADMEQLTSLLLGCGARIDEINTLRRSLDRVKGGGLAREAFPARIISLLLSDVVDSHLEAIASGPTVPNPTTCADARALLEKSDLLAQTPDAIVDFLKKSTSLAPSKFVEFGETQGGEGNILVIGSNVISAEAAQTQATCEGFDAQILTTSLQGEAVQVGCELGAMLRQENFSQYAVRNMNRPFCLIFGGETTVTLSNATGRGGRNQELALAAVKDLAGLRKVMLITLATDGEDGPTDAAGAVVTGKTLARAQELGLDVESHLYNHDAYPFFDTLDDLLKPGVTGTNVNDLTFLFGL